MTLATLVLLGVFVSLGRWQWSRGDGKQQIWAEFERNAPAEPLGTRRIAELPRFSHVALEGSYLADRQFLLDNRSHAGKPGYEVLTPFMLHDGRVMLVNRGWMPFSGYRDRLPDVSKVPWSADAYLRISGRIEELPVAGLASGRAPPGTEASWPRVTTFPTHEELAGALGRALEPRMLLLDADMPGGYLRAWRPPGLDPARHFSYAIQWWGFAVVLLVLYFGLNLRKVSR